MAEVVKGDLKFDAILKKMGINEEQMLDLVESSSDEEGATEDSGKANATFWK